ncbi:hypothetical protein J8J14_06785 [Roseomonas sp. SSH11]|uniref:Uncharacterized protein n=1 Tax=Pararoseomonas baculiformis TaxID=2820812 RepID=A0ABS4ABU2_9PROT|nr:hypothetical protein [Pararoseomonas baculiformis]MBP0444483.1 hypothetical protein [Pararoseomonas baculiformis]
MSDDTPTPDPSGMASAIAAAQAALDADDLVRSLPPGTPARRERMQAIIHAVAAEWEVGRMELTMALTQLSVRRN